MTASFNCPYEVERIGRLGDGGKWVCGLSRYEQTSKPCIVYSFGIQQESSFEEELLERTNCELWGYDFSVDEFGPQLKTKMKDRAHFTKAGISGKTDTTQNPPYYSIADLMDINGHTHVDVLKMDIEGYEFESLTSLLQAFDDGEVPVSQILIEIHLDPGRKSVDDFLAWWESLEAVGYRAAWTEPNLLTVSLPLADGMPRYAEVSSET